MRADCEGWEAKHVLSAPLWPTQEATLGREIVLQVLKDRRENDRVLSRHTQTGLELGGRPRDCRVERYNRGGVELSGDRILQTLAFVLGASNQYRNEHTEIIGNCTICSGPAQLRPSPLGRVLDAAQKERTQAPRERCDRRRRDREFRCMHRIAPAAVRAPARSSIQHTPSLCRIHFEAGVFERVDQTGFS